MAFKTAIFDDIPMVISSPTGSGKTAVLELTIIRLLMLMDQGIIKRIRVIYGKHYLNHYFVWLKRTC